MTVRISAEPSLTGAIQAFIDSRYANMVLDSPERSQLHIATGEGRQCEARTLYCGGWITCEQARDLAGRLGMATTQVGELLNVANVKIRQCGLGCF